MCTVRDTINCAYTREPLLSKNNLFAGRERSGAVWYPWLKMLLIFDATRDKKNDNGGEFNIVAE